MPSFGVNDNLFDLFINALKQSIIKDVNFLTYKTKMQLLKQSICGFEKMRKFIVTYKQMQMNEHGKVEEQEGDSSDERMSSNDSQSECAATPRYNTFKLIGGLTVVQDITDIVFGLIAKNEPEMTLEDPHHRGNPCFRRSTALSLSEGWG